MRVFRRRRGRADQPAATDQPAGADQPAGTDPPVGSGPLGPGRAAAPPGGAAEEAQDRGAGPEPTAGGPFDVESLPDDGVERVDLGALLVPQLPGVELRLEVQAGVPPLVSAVTLATPTSMLQLSAFAAPRSTGIWAQTRADLLTAHQEAGLAVAEAAGEFGPELRTQVPTGVPDQVLPVRMVAVEGPRWLLRGNFVGAAALEPGADRVLTQALRLTAVVRGREAMAVGELLPLRPPPGVALPPLPGVDGSPVAGPDGPSPAGPGAPPPAAPDGPG